MAFLIPVCLFSQCIRATVAQGHNTHGTLAIALPAIFCHLLQLMPTAGRGQDSGLMGK